MYKRCARGGKQSTTVHNNDHPEGFQSTIQIDPLSPEGLNFQTVLGRIPPTKRLAANIFCDVIQFVGGRQNKCGLPSYPPWTTKFLNPRWIQRMKYIWKAKQGFPRSAATCVSYLKVGNVIFKKKTRLNFNKI